MPDIVAQRGMIRGADGALYPPQVEPRGRAEVVALLLQSDAGLSAEQAETLALKLLAVVNLGGAKICTCLHVEGASDSAHGHGYYQCETCGGFCCSERWTGHAVAGLRWMELMVQHHTHSRSVVKGLNLIEDRMLTAVERIARTVPAECQKQAMRQLIQNELANFSHIWFQTTMGDYLYDASARDGEWAPRRPRMWEEEAAVLGEKLKAVEQGMTPQDFLERFRYRDAIEPDQALRRVASSLLPGGRSPDALQPTAAQDEAESVILERAKVRVR